MDFDSDSALDVGLGEAMDVAFELISTHLQNHDSPDQLRLRIVAHNLNALAQVLLIADDHPEEIQLNIKQVVLGILGTSDWIMDHLPEIDLPDPNSNPEIPE